MVTLAKQARVNKRILETTLMVKRSRELYDAIENESKS